jgi:hypothetical protein
MYVKSSVVAALAWAGGKHIKRQCPVTQYAVQAEYLKHVEHMCACAVTSAFVFCGIDSI